MTHAVAPDLQRRKPGRRSQTPGRSGRRSPGWVPNQHGAWAMLATPLLVGVVASEPRWVHLPLAAFWFTGYFAFFATGLWLKSRRRARYLPPVRVYAAATLVLGAIVLLMRPDLARWAPLFLPPLAIGLVASATRHERALVSGLATTIGSCLMTVVAYDAGGGTDWERAWQLAAVLAAYFAGTVLYVKTLIRERGSLRHYGLSVGFHGLATLAAIPAGSALVLVFALLTVRAAVVPAFAVSPRRAGMGEIAATLAVAAAALATL